MNPLSLTGQSQNTTSNVPSFSLDSGGNIASSAYPYGQFGQTQIGATDNSFGANVGSFLQSINPFKPAYAYVSYTPSVSNNTPSQPTSNSTSTVSSPSQSTPNTNIGSSGVPYAPSFAGQTVQNSNGTFRSDDGKTWTMISGSAGSTPSVNQYGQTADQISRAQSAYDAAVQTLKGFVPLLQNQADTSTGAINQTTQGTINQAQSGEDTATGQTNTAINQAGQSLPSRIGSAKSYAASFGSGLSSFGQGLEQNAYRDVGNTIGGLQTNLQNAITNFENQKVQAKQWGQNQIAGIQNQLQQGLQQVALNVNQTDIQKAEAVTKIQQVAQGQINSIQSILAQLQANITQSQNQALMYASLYGNAQNGFGANLKNLSDAVSKYGYQQIPQILGGIPGMSGIDERLYGSNKYPNQ